MPGSSLYSIIAKELAGITEAERDAQWGRLRAELVRFEAALYKRKIITPAQWIGRYGITGIGEPNYVDLLFADVTGTGRIARQYGFRRAVALAAKHAELTGNSRELVRAIFLLSHHSYIKRLETNRRSAAKPRPRKGVDQLIIEEAQRLRANTKISRKIAGPLEAALRRRGIHLSRRSISNKLKKIGI